MNTIRLTMAQALVRALVAQRTEIDGAELPLFAGVWAIFGHGNVAGLGEALQAAGDSLPTYRAHNEQAMALAAIAYAKTMRRRRMMACTSSIGPGATNMVTAAAVAHVNRLPVLLLPGDVFAGRRPDPVLQQVEDFGDATVSANDCFRPVSRFFDRITRPEQLLTALPQALGVLTDPAACGPVTLALCQDVQAEAFDWPESFFAPRLWHIRRPRPDLRELEAAADLLRGAQAPLIIAGGGVHYAEATEDLADFATAHGIPVAETQAGKSALPHDHPLNLGGIGVTGSSAANQAAERADVILAVGTRLADFATGSWALFRNPARRLIGLNVQPLDAGKRFAVPLVADAGEGLTALSASLGDHTAPAAWTQATTAALAPWRAAVRAATAPTNAPCPSDAQVIGAVQRAIPADAIVVAAAGGLPGELHKLWQAGRPGGYHVEYGFSCMGYEIAGAVGVKLAAPDREVVVLLGDGSWLMMNSEIATSVMLGLKLTVVLLDNGGFGCIDRLQRATGGAGFNNLLADARHAMLPALDFTAQAVGLGAIALKAAGIAELESALAVARDADRTTVIVVDTDPAISTGAGGHWWDVGVPEVSARAEVRRARAEYETQRLQQRLGN
ncbi:3D-(3,5/4)-trihydroxycyclohexane-1,2-dione acylhydrolase (decyclizing) [Limobrevibacterium gyesilva]|uniref:3D-(3,5/4)-trihydroxycyclohexane-1,2-dione acylhydrolase (Decyclizing) n=1 Tax=Limobrevibacterium gyesilva TaxID=2991712 RepID=A0AA41YM99_9PROT|nr:3D-(3,5/4)-trihydroxycyclohexane-1,2-dione acylhydrolase (decyclizing) [Limobrevibacterium gyesilva]MCW3475335.1 3D-(3,5/4)-trihydroxycyclohexane-1,2-dione acylhydrolase (decyclizing) [Limobrevibacterium gyesilva]